jgi:hypothetical protein
MRPEAAVGDADVRVCPLTVWAWRLGSLAQADLWQRYIDLGGSAGPGEVADYLWGSAVWPAGEHNILAQALNERLWGVGLSSLAPVRSTAGP